MYFKKNGPNHPIISFDELRKLFPQISFPENGPNGTWLNDNDYSFSDAPIVEIPEQTVPIFNKVAYLAGLRYTKQNINLTVQGMSLPTDIESRTNLIAARIEAKESPNYAVKWKIDGQFIELTASQVIFLADTVSTYIKKCFLAEETVLSNIDSYDSAAEIMAAFDEALTD